MTAISQPFDNPLTTDDQADSRKPPSIARQLLSNRLSLIGFILLGLFVVVALAGLGLIVRGAAERFAAERPRRGSRYLGEAIVLGVAAVALASPWYWRAWSASGNPFFPELFSLFGARPLGRWRRQTWSRLRHCRRYTWRGSRYAGRHRWRPGNGCSHRQQHRGDLSRVDPYHDWDLCAAVSQQGRGSQTGQGI